MVAVISGNGLGLGNTSLTQLGNAQGGAATLGQAGNASYVNAATGNLILQSANEGLLFDGLPLNVLLTYNSLGSLNGQPNWSYGFSRSIGGLTGTVNTAGSTITRTGDDGSMVVYTYDTERGLYVSSGQSGAEDTLSCNAGGSFWTYTDAADQIQETYDAGGQLLTLTNVATGARYSFDYGNGQLTQIVAGDGDTLILGHNGAGQLQYLEILEVPPGQSVAVGRQTASYDYDAQGRLISVTTNLASDTDTADNSYTTTYTYDGSSDRIASVTQSDGTTVSYGYTQDAQGAWQVTSIITGTGTAAQAVTLSYGVDSTAVTDAQGRATTYQYDADGNLTAVVAPSVNGSSPTTTYTYDTNGNLLTSTDPAGAVTTYQYDTSGNLLSVEDGAGNTITYTYDANDQLTSKTTYTVAAQGRIGQSGYVAPSGAQTSYNVYSSNGQLRYTVDPLGNVSEYSYTSINGISELTAIRQYRNVAYSLANSSPDNPPSLLDLETWSQSSTVLATLDQSILTGYSYDVRGQLALQTQYDTVDTNGNGVMTDGAVVTRTTYDAQGRLLSTSAMVGTNRSTPQTTAYTYDGMGRIVSKADALGNVTHYVYDDSANTITITQSNGLTTTQVRNSAGQLISTVQYTVGDIAPIPAASEVNYSYSTSDATTTTTYRVAYQSNTITLPSGEQQSVTGFFVTMNIVDTQTHAVLYTRLYGMPLTSNQLAQLAGSSSVETLTSILTPSSSDQISFTVTGDDGQQTHVQYENSSIMDASGIWQPVFGEMVTAQHGVQSIQYATPLTIAQLDSLGTSPTWAGLQSLLAATASPLDEVTISAVDNSSTGTSASIAFGVNRDASGSLVSGEFITITQHDSAGRTTKSTLYATPLTATQLASLGSAPTVAQIEALTTPSTADQVTLNAFNSNGQLQARVLSLSGGPAAQMVNGVLQPLESGEYVVSIQYDAGGEVTGEVYYATPLNEAQMASLGSAPTVGQIEAFATPSAYDASVTYLTNSQNQAIGTITGEAYQTSSGVAFGYFVMLKAYDDAGRQISQIYYATPLTQEQFQSLGSSPTYAQIQALLTPSSNDDIILGVYDEAGQIVASIQGIYPGTTSTDSAASTPPQETVTIWTVGANGNSSQITYANKLSSAQVASLGLTPTLAQVQALVTPSSDDQLDIVLYDEGNWSAKVQYSTQYVSNPDGTGSFVSGNYVTFNPYVISGQNIPLQTYLAPLTPSQMAQFLASPTVETLQQIVQGGGSGRTTTYTYDSDGDPVAITDPGGATTYNLYDADNRLAYTVDPDGDVTGYQRDGDGRVTATTQYATALTASQLLALSNDPSVSTLQAMLTASGADLTNTSVYDAAGRVVATIDASGAVVTMTYDGTGQVVSSRAYGQLLTGSALAAFLANPNVATLPVSPSDRVTHFFYDADGQEVATIDAAGHVTRYVYDNAGHEIETIAYATSVSGVFADASALMAALTVSAQDRVTRTYYDGTGTAVAQIDAGGYLTTTAHDETTQTTITARYASALTAEQLNALTGSESVSALVALLGASPVSEVSTCLYDADGRKLVETGPDGTVTNYTYNSVGQLTQTVVTPGNGQGAARTTSVAYDGFGDVLSQTDASGSTVTYTYNLLGEPITATDALGNTLYSYYDADGRLAYTVQGQSLNGIANAQGAITAYSYNALGQVVSVRQLANLVTLTTSGTGSGSVLNVATATQASVAAVVSSLSNLAVDRITTTTYTLDGQVASTIDGRGYQTAYQYDAFGDLTQVQQQLSQPGSALSAANSTTTTYAYDALGERTGETNGAGSGVASTTSVQYDAFGHVIETTDGNGNTVDYAYDALGRQVSSSQVVQGVTRTTRSTYDAFGRVLTQTDALGRTTTYQYDTAQHQVTVTSPEGVVTTMTQDAYGDTVSITDGNGQTTTSTYDADGRLLTVTDPLGRVTTNQYDADGELLRTTDAAGQVVAYTYDGQGHALTRTVDPDGLALTTTYAYDDLGDVLSVTDPSGTVTSYTYDSDGNLLSEVDDVGGLNRTTTYTYDGDNQVLSVTTAAGTAAAATTQFIYDNLERLSQQIVDPAGLALTTRYTYDANGNVTSVTDPNGNVTRTFYDAANEKVASVDATGAVVQYIDDADGRPTVTRGYATVLTASQQATLAATPTLATLVGMMPAAQATDAVQQNVYDADGRLIYQLNGTDPDVTQYSYDADGRVIHTVTYALPPSAGTISATATAADVAPLVRSSAQDLSATTVYDADGEAVYTLDGTGDVTQAIYDADGRVVATIAYATPLSASQITTLGSTPTPAQIAAVITVSASDRRTDTAYDSAGRVALTIDPTGAVTAFTYDADGRVTSTRAYATALTATQRATLGNTPSLAAIQALLTASSADPIGYRVYDALGELRYSIDRLGYVTETRYDNAGRVTETLAYPQAVAVSSEVTALQQGTALNWLNGQVGNGTANPDDTAVATLALYDSAGRLRFTVQQNANGTVGTVTERTYDANGNLIARIAYGQSLILAPDIALSDQLTTASVANAVMDFANQTTNEVYDADNRAIYTIDAAGNVTQTTYDAFGRVTQTMQYARPIAIPATVTADSVADAITATGGAVGARLTTTTYDSRGNVLTTGDALGVNTTYTYDGRGLKATMTNRDGAQWIYSYDSAGRLALTQSPAVTVGSYNAGGTFQSAANQFVYTSVVYDAFGEPAVVQQSWGLSAAAATVSSQVSYGYDADGRVVASTNAVNVTTHTIYNALGQAVVSQDGNGNYSYQAYDKDGQLAYTVDGAGDVVGYTYDAYGNRTGTTAYAIPLNTAAISGWSAGQPLSQTQLQQGLVTSANDRTVTIAYNQLNQVTQVQQAAITYTASMGALAGTVTTGSPTTTYTYDAYGNTVSQSVLIQGALTVGSTSTPAVWATTYTYYDTLDRAVMVIAPAGDANTPEGYVTTTAYDAFGDVITETQYAQAISTAGIDAATPPDLPPLGNNVIGFDRTTQFTYDAIGRVQSQTDIGTMFYTGGTLGVQDGNSSDYSESNASAVTSYTYDGEGRVLTKTVNGATTTTTYDALGRVLSVTAPPRQVLVSNWQTLLLQNPTWDLTTAELYANASPITTYVYDALGDALSTTVTGVSSQSPIQTWSYYDAAGRLGEQVDATGTAHYTYYDNNNNVITQSYSLTGETAAVQVVTTTNYDADNRVISTVTQRSGSATPDAATYVKYNAFSEVVAQGDNASTYAASFTYDRAGNRVTAPDSGSGAIHTYGYDLAGRLVSDTSTVTGGGGTATTLDVLDLAGHAIRETRPSSAAASGSGSTASTFTYDRWGNVLAQIDANGNLTTYEYDSQNHLIQEVEAAVTVVSDTGDYSTQNPVKQWHYNIDGELMIVRDENGNDTDYTYDAAGNMRSQQDATGAFTYTAYDGYGRAVAQQTPSVQAALGVTTVIDYTAYDALGRVVALGYFNQDGPGTARSLVTRATYLLNSNGDRVQSADGMGLITHYSYDSQHRVLTSTTPESETTTYVYDVNGKLIKQTDPMGNIQTWVYSYFGQVLSHVDENNATYTYTYDANSGLLTQETSNWTDSGASSAANAVNSTQAYQYFADGQVSRLTDTVSGATSTYIYAYDADGNETQESVTTPIGSDTTTEVTTLAYDSHNRLIEANQTDTSGAVSMRMAYVYDAVGNRRAVFARSAYGSTATPIPTANTGPTLGTALANQTLQPAQALTYAIPSGSFNDNLGMGLTYTVSGLPNGVSFNAANQTFSGVPTTPGNYTITVTATDALGRSVTSSFSVAVPQVQAGFTAPATNQTVQYGGFAFTVPPATSPNGSPITYTASYFNGTSWVALPSWIQFNASTLTFTGTPPVGSAGTYTLAVSASGNNEATATNQFTLTVEPITAPVFQGALPTQTVKYSGFNIQVPVATDANGLAVDYWAGYYNGTSWVALPSWITFNASTRTFSGTPPVGSAGTYQLAVWAEGAGTTTSSVLQFSIVVPAIDYPVFTSTTPTQNALPGQPFSITVQGATDTSGLPLVYSGVLSIDNFTSTAPLPSWIQFNPNTLTFSGTPPAGVGGTFELEVVATVAGTNISMGNPFALVVTEGPVYMGGISSAVYMLDGTSGSWTIPSGAFVNPMGRPLTYSIQFTNGAPNSGYTFDAATGKLSLNVPNNPFNKNYPFIITATDPADGLSASAGFTLVCETTSINPKLIVTSESDSTSTSEAEPAPTPAPAPVIAPSAIPDALMTSDMTDSISAAASPQIVQPDITPTPPPPHPAPAPGPSPTPSPTPTPAPTPAPNVVADWFTYDNDNRVLVNNGSLVNGSIQVSKASGSAINAYDAAGNVMDYTVYNQAGAIATQQNYYDQLNELVLVETPDPYDGNSEQVSESRYYNADGDLVSDVQWGQVGQMAGGYIVENIGGSPVNVPTQFSEAGWVLQDTVYTYTQDEQVENRAIYSVEDAQDLLNQYGANVDASSYAEQVQQVPTTTTATVPAIGALNDGILKLAQDTSYVGGYDADGNLTQYLSENPGSDDPQNWTLGGSSLYTTTFIKQNGLLAASTTVTPNVSSGDSPATDTSHYNDLGELVSVTGTDYGNPFQRNFAYDADGQILERQIISGGSTQTVYYAYANGQELGGVDSDGNIDIDPTSSGFANSDLGSSGYQVQIGDTLASIAQTVYGDSNYGYIIAEANGLSSDSQLVVGMNLTIPQVTTHSDTADTFKPYNAKSIIGSTDPTATPPPPPPPAAPSSSGCGAIGEIVMVAVIIVASIYTAGLAAGALGATATAAGGTTTFALGTAAVTGGGLVGTAGALSAAVGIGSAAIGGFVGSLAGQAVGDAEGISNGFSLKQALTAGLSAGIGSGIGSALSAAGVTGTTLATNSSSFQPLGASLYGANNYLSNAAASDITGQANHFSWDGLVASAVAAGITNAAESEGGFLHPLSGVGYGLPEQVAGNLLGGGVNRETSQLLGDDHVSSWLKISEDTVGDALGGAVIAGMDSLDNTQQGYQFDFTKGGQGVSGQDDMLSNDNNSDQPPNYAMMEQAVNGSPSVVASDWQTVYDAFGTVRPDPSQGAMNSVQASDISGSSSFAGVDTGVSLDGYDLATAGTGAQIVLSNSTLDIANSQQGGLQLLGDVKSRDGEQDYIEDASNWMQGALSLDWGVGAQPSGGDGSFSLVADSSAATLALGGVTPDRFIQGALEYGGDLYGQNPTDAADSWSQIGRLSAGLKIGSRGARVSELQTLLGVQASGVFGPKTEQALRSSFVSVTYAAAQASEATTGIPAAITTAQAILESNYGMSIPTDVSSGQYSYNIFGVKAGAQQDFVTSWTHEVVNGASERVLGNFASYDSFQGSLDAHSTFLTSNRRYRSLFDSSDPTTWANGLQAKGYATDPHYAAKLISVMKQWNLK